MLFFETQCTSWPALGLGSGLSVSSAESSTPLRTTGPRDGHDSAQQASSADWAAAAYEPGVQDDNNGGPWQRVQPSSKRSRRERSEQQQLAAETRRSSAQFCSVPSVTSAVVSTVARHSSQPGSQPTQRTSDRRHSTSTSRISIGGGDGRGVNSQQQRQQHRQQQQQQQQLKPAGGNKVIVIGRRNATHGKITAARPYVAKSVYCVDNILKDVSESDMESFLNHNGISVISCNAVKPRRSAWQRQRGIIPDDRAAFRVCIAREDSDKLLSEDLWPAHVCVSSWHFIKHDNADQRSGQGAGDDMDTLISDAVPSDQVNDQINDDSSSVLDNCDNTVIYRVDSDGDQGN